jgi:DNA repair exonuclease SbcCD ATPase subunit
VVFAKYFALHSQEPAVPSEIPDPPYNPMVVHEEPKNPESVDLVEIRRNVHDLQQRFNELEFERAERRRVRNEIRALEERLQQSFARISERQETIEQHLSKIASLPPAPTAEDLAALRIELRAMDFKSVQQRIERVENGLQSCIGQMTGKSESPSVDLLDSLDARLRNAECRLAGMVDEGGANPPNGGQAQFIAAFQELGQLKTTLQNVTVRYSEIGELKKNHLVLQNLIESLQQSVESSRAAAHEGSMGKIPELEKEVLALRAENRKTLERMELMESQALPTAMPCETASLQEMSSWKEDVAAFSKLGMEEMCRMQAELSALSTRVNEGFQIHEKFPEQLTSLAAEIRSLEQQYSPLCQSMERLSSQTSGTLQNITDLNGEVFALREGLLQAQSQIQSIQVQIDCYAAPAAAEASPPTLADIHLIRENLDEIRSFMAKMSRKI